MCSGDKVELVKNVKKKTFLILQMKTHIRDNHAEYQKIETSGLNPNRFQPKFCLKSVKKKHLNLLKKTFEVILNEKFVAQNMRGMKFVAHKVVFRTISPFLRNM